MTINGTLLVQIINFIIGYVLISKFFLKPAYDVIKHEEQAMKDMQAQVRVEAHKVVVQEETAKQRWLACKNYFNEHKPSVDVVETKKTENASITLPEKISTGEQKKLEDELVNTLKRKIMA